MFNIDQLQASLGTDHVPRFPTHWILKQDYVSQHQYRATLFYAYLGGKELLAMLTHDSPEAITSDLPSPIKKELTGLEKFDYLSVPFIDPKEKRLGKCCDKLDLVFKLRQQFNAVGRLPDKLMIIYETELDNMLDIAKELGIVKEVKKLLKDLS